MKKRILAAVCILTALLFAAGVYLRPGYEASEHAGMVMAEGKQYGSVYAFVPEEGEEILGGLIFYPGGLVDHRAYAPLMQELRSRGVLGLLCEMPLDLAVLDVNAAKGLQALYPEAEHWLIGGHSLGGAMAAAYLEDHADEFEGLVLLGAYSAADLSHTELRVLSVYGTQDGVLNRDQYEACRNHYPQTFAELAIDGGCHAYFGDYGAQKGDGQPKISRQEQLEITAEAIAAMFQT